MKVHFLFIVLMLLAACKESHQHDGVYIAEQPNLGVMKTWIVEGDKLTYYLMGNVTVVNCKQYDDRLETSDDKVYPFDNEGNLIIPAREGKTAEEKLIKRSSTTKVTPTELEKMIDAAMPPPGVMKDRDVAN